MPNECCYFHPSVPVLKSMNREFVVKQYVFGIMIPPADQPADRALSETIEHYWTNFAKTGDPNGGGLPAWPEVGAQGAYLDFTTAGPIHATGLRKQACALFHRRVDSELDALAKELRR
jgi:para-nitrobenzyl esterase